MMTENKIKAAAAGSGRLITERAESERQASGRRGGDLITERVESERRESGRCGGHCREHTERTSLLGRYFQQGWLGKKYYGAGGYLQPYSAEDRLMAGMMLYEDFLKWGRGQLRVRDYAVPKVDGNSIWDDWQTGWGAENFRRALEKVSAPFVPVLYSIVLEEKEIRAPKGASARERLYFNDEIKSLLCRALDELVPYYCRKV